MSCPRTPHLLSEYFDETQSPLARQEMERHLKKCQACSDELTSLLLAKSSLERWQTQRVPRWDRTVPLFKAEHRREGLQRRNWITQWFPTAASLAMLVLVLFNVEFYRDENGFRLVFGASATANSQAQLERFRTEQRQQQEQLMSQYLARLDERQENNNLRLMQVVLDEARQISAENFEQIYTYFEQQRQLDMETVQVSYQQLLDRDFETLRTMQQLAGVMQFPGQVR